MHLGQLEHDAVSYETLEHNGSGECLRFWECEQPAVIVGHLGSIDKQVHVDACLRDGVPIVRRLSGGGAVLIGKGCLNYSLVLSLEKRPALSDVERSYPLILTPIVERLRVPGLSIRGTSDLAIADCKVSGNAQRRGRRALLHHGTILYDFDIGMLERYLKEPDRQPPYRVRRRHGSFVTNLPLSPGRIRKAVREAWNL